MKSIAVVIGLSLSLFNRAEASQPISYSAKVSVLVNSFAPICVQGNPAPHLYSLVLGQLQIEGVPKRLVPKSAFVSERYFIDPLSCYKEAVLVNQAFQGNVQTASFEVPVLVEHFDVLLPGHTHETSMVRYEAVHEFELLGHRFSATGYCETKSATANETCLK